MIAPRTDPVWWRAASPTDGTLTLFLLVDALRVDYVDAAPFLSSLARRSACGVMRECFGFVPRHGYFGGLDASAYGFTNMYALDPDRSPFGVARWISKPGLELPRSRAWVEAEARKRMSRFEQLYASTLEMPLDRAPLFDAVEKYAPWDPRVGYRSLFAILDEQRIPWTECLWPGTNTLRDRSDAGLVRQFLDQLRPTHRFAALHLQALDAIGHAHGPASRQVLDAIARTDALVAGLFDELQRRYARVNGVLFGDHGMVPVTATLDVAARLERTGLRHGIDYACFLDSTMVRLWFFHADARRRIEACLADVRGGHLMSPEELARESLGGMDRRNAEAIFLCDPGVLVFPNYFQGGGQPIAGMHGYDPGFPDNQGAFMLFDSAQPELAGLAFDAVEPADVFPLLLHGIGLSASDRSPRPLPRPLPRPRSAAPGARRLVARPEPEAEAAVRAHLARVVNAILARCGSVEAILLTGSFGRGEGGVQRTSDGRWVPVNDFDLVVVDHRDVRGSLAGLGEALAREIGLDFVDIAWTDALRPPHPVSILAFDTRYGTTILHGDRGIVDRLPPIAAAEISRDEPIILLLNRTAGVLSGVRWARTGDGTWHVSAEDPRYLTNQLVKAAIAVGDAHLVRWNAYDPSYRRRAERVAAMAAGAGIPGPYVELIARAHAFKAVPDYGANPLGPGDVRPVADAVRSALDDSLAARLGAAAVADDDHFDRWVGSWLTPPQVVAENRLITERAGVPARLRPGRPTDVSLRGVVYRAIGDLLDGLAGDPAAAAERAAHRLESCFMLPHVDRTSPEEMRRIVVDLWFATCH